MRLNITAEFAKKDDCLDRMIPADLRSLVSERDAALRERDALLLALNPRLWTLEMQVAWHQNIPDVHKAFAAILELGKGADHER